MQNCEHIANNADQGNAQPNVCMAADVAQKDWSVQLGLVRCVDGVARVPLNLNDGVIVNKILCIVRVVHIIALLQTIALAISRAHLLVCRVHLVVLFVFNAHFEKVFVGLLGIRGCVARLSIVLSDPVVHECLLRFQKHFLGKSYVQVDALRIVGPSPVTMEQTFTTRSVHGKTGVRPVTVVGEHGHGHTRTRLHQPLVRETICGVRMWLKVFNLLVECHNGRPARSDSMHPHFHDVRVHGGIVNGQIHLFVE